MRRHPRVYLPERRKEVHYFDRHHERGAGWYAGFFPETARAADFDAIGEVTPRYLFDPQVPARIHALLPEVRLIAILRDPIERCRSHHGLAVRDAAERRPLAAYLDANPEVFERGLYAAQLERYLERFPRARFEVLIHERVVRDPDAALRRVATFLGIDPEGFAGAPAPPLNVSYRPRFPRLRATAVRAAQRLADADRDRFVERARRLGAGRWFGVRTGEPPPVEPALRAALRARYAADRRRLQELLDDPLPEWDGG